MIRLGSMSPNAQILTELENILRHIHCDECRKERVEYRSDDQKGTGFFSNICVGFASKPITELKSPIDVMILAESHGGGNYEEWGRLESQRLSLENNMRLLEEYYRLNRIRKFHQSCIRELLNKLDQRHYIWFFTDVVKCFVAKRNMNFKLAVEHCRVYLNGQIRALDPKVILTLGNTAWKTLTEKPLKDKAVEYHGKSQTVRILAKERIIVYSVFPGQSTADKWIEAETRLPALKTVEDLISRV
jgi:uracil-DNA glycosylase family 4